MTLLQIVRNKVESERKKTDRSPLDIVIEIINDEKLKQDLINSAEVIGIENVDDSSLNEVLHFYRSELYRVVSMEEGIFRSADANGYMLSPEEDTCWGLYYQNIVNNPKISKDDRARIINECNVIAQQFLPQPSQNQDKRGLVIGQVQSGKTTIFNGIISAAADIGFNLIIVLSGTIESLRKQTQSRIVKDVTIPWSYKNNTQFYFTWISDSENPGLTGPGNASIQLSEITNKNRRQIGIGVFLKNKKVLQNLRNYINTIHPLSINGLRALIIDDEADQATPNAGVKSETISAINESVKALIVPNTNKPSFTQGKSTYLGFTATPFANLLNEAGPDKLYPKDFIYFLQSSNRYFGPMQLFGNPKEIEGEETIVPLSMVNSLSKEDIEGLVPPRGNERLSFKPRITKGLKDAIKWYIIASASRRSKDELSWSTMLIHTSSNTNDHINLFQVVRDHFKELADDFAINENEWIDLWEREKSKVSIEEFYLAFPKYGDPAPEGYCIWETIKQSIPDVFKDVKIKVDNSLYTGPERLSFLDDAPKEERLQIAIGGNTLSRGLTLEGLVSSVFVRKFTKQSSYDTLLQMGRWFGYRQGYELLSRIWTTTKLYSSFKDLVVMEIDLRNAMQLYLQGESPANKAPIIRKMPAMAITRKSVIGNIESVGVDYSGAAPQTIYFLNDFQLLTSNLETTEKLLSGIKDLDINAVPNNNRLIYKCVPRQLIQKFLSNFLFYENSNLFNKKHMLDFIEKNSERYKLWNVVVLGGSSDRTFSGIKMNNRTRLKLENEKEENNNFIDLGSLRATRDLLCDDPILLQTQKIIKENELWEIRRNNNMNPCLIIYPIDRYSKVDSTRKLVGSNKHRVDLDAKNDLIGLSLIMSAPNKSDLQGAEMVQLKLEDVYSNDDEADDNPDMPEVL